MAYKTKEEQSAHDKAYYAANRERINAVRRAHRAANPGKNAARNKPYREVNRDKIAAKSKADWANTETAPAKWESMNPAVEYVSFRQICGRQVQVGKDGSIWTFVERYQEWRRCRVRMIQGFNCGTHYARINITGVNRKQAGLVVPCIVLEAFGFPRPEHSEVWYENGNRADCSLSNIRWVPKGTSAVGINAGISRPKGELATRAILKDEEVRLARRLYKEGYTLESLRLIYGVERGTIGAAVSGRTFRHLPDACPILPRHSRGSLHGRALLDEDDVTEIKKLLVQGMSRVAIAERFRVSSGSISAIARNKTWKHVPWPSEPAPLPEVMIASPFDKRKIRLSSVESALQDR
jgi:hypothetical protein